MTSDRRGVWLVWLVLALGLLGPRPAHAQPRVDAGNERYGSARLGNGLRVYLAEDHRVPLVAITITYAAGESLDPPAAPGVAALVAQLLPVASTPHLPDGAGDLIAAAGFYPWTVEAKARSSDTRLRLVVPAAAVDLALFIEAERMGFAAEALSNGFIGWAREKVEKEYTAGSVVQRLDDVALAMAYGPKHPYARIGSPPRLDQVSLDWLGQRLRRYYNPATAQLSITGDFDSQRLLPVIQRLFGRLKGTALPADPAPPSAPAPVQGEVREAYIRPGFVWAWRTPSYLTPDDIGLDVAARYLGHHLARRLGTPGERAMVFARQVSHPRGSVFFLYVSAAEDARAATERVVREEIDALAAGKIDAAELQLAKSTISYEIAGSMDDLEGRAFFLTSYAGYDGKLDGFAAHLQSYSTLDAARFSDVVRRQLGAPAVRLTLAEDPSQRSGRLVGMPTPLFTVADLSGAAEQPDAPDWYRPPTAIAQTRFDPPKLLELEASRARVLFMPRFGLPRVKLRLAINWQEAAIVPGVRQLLLSCLLRSKPAGRSKLEDRLADVGAQLEEFYDEDALILIVSTLADNVEPVAAALRDTLSIERFQSADFEAARKDLSEPKEPVELKDTDRFQHWYEQLVFPKGHRMHHEGIEDATRRAAVRAVGQKQLEQLWKAERRAEHVTLAIVGPLDEAAAQKLAAAVIPRLPAAKATKPGSALAPRTFLVDAPGQSDVLVRFSWPGSPWGSAGYVDSLGLRWTFDRRPEGSFDKALRENGVEALSDLFTNSLATRDGSNITVSGRVPKAELVGLFKAVAQHAERLQKGDLTWDGVQESRRAAVQWVTKMYEGASGSLGLLGSHADLAVPVTSSQDMYLLAQRIDRASLVKAAGVLAPSKATVVVYGAVAELKAALDAVGFPAATVVSGVGSAEAK